MSGVCSERAVCIGLMVMEALLFLKNSQFIFKHVKTARHRWFTPVILATQEEEIRRIVAQSQPLV
jgi:hypothetical protein